MLLDRLYRTLIREMGRDKHYPNHITKTVVESYLSDQRVRNIWKMRDWEFEKIIDSIASWSGPMKHFEFVALVKSLFTSEQLDYIFDESHIYCKKKNKFFGFHVLTKRKVDKQAVTKYLFDHPYGLTREEIEKLTEHLPLGYMSKEKFLKYMIFGEHFLQYKTSLTLMDYCRC
ncbi:uncharacterized protein LOC126847318 [Adelges cooleyi]|uniref:uncharacterized protein LOC126845885 n=1 Tax=Adelges cooleyi TaxID=133065 RepID=UPI0021803E16|nr:uncharacterized protein LOC126845885 [Adelges cooleyi]XP_050443813.1 uncharacterized protein LOC126847318 [Adelges cooleyi]